MKNWENIFRITKQGNAGITGQVLGTNNGSCRDFKMGGKITNRDKRDFKSGQGLQIGAKHRHLNATVFAAVVALLKE